ncbi:hypothetical protein ACS0TY_004297 [Phlomoides rotata]
MRYLKPLKLYRELLKSNEMKGGRLLGLDVGDKYVGLSVSDPYNKIASPLSVLVRSKTNIDLISSDFQKLAMHVKLFIDDLNKTGKFDDLMYTFWDECFTSKSVEFLLKPLAMHPVQQKTVSDKFAAVGILQGFLDFANRSEDQNQ